MSYNDTQTFVELLINAPIDRARVELHFALQLSDFNEGLFYAAIVDHFMSLKLSNSEWFTLLSRLPNRMLRSQLDLNKILSIEQIKALPPVTG